MPKIEFTCQQCGVKGMCYPSQHRSYCSQSCRAKAVAASGMPLKPRTGKSIPCEVCGTMFWRRKYRADTARYCSASCHDAWQRRNTVTQTCGTCGMTYTLKPSQKYYGSKFCSRACEARSRIRRPLDREHNGKPAVIGSGGYVLIYEPGYPGASKSGWIAEHRWVVGQSLGRPLLSSEHVHHRNHDRADNRIENLEILTASAHSRITARENSEALKAALAARQQVMEYERKYGPLT